MFRLRNLQPADLGGGVNLVDLGASGAVPEYWKPMAHLVNLIGFDPNEAECQRLSNQKTRFRSQKFLPYAVAGKDGDYSLHKTKSIYCWSLLKPNSHWLRRFAFSELFELTGSEVIRGATLGSIAELATTQIDAIKLDTQGLELPILESSEQVLTNCIWIETETGLSENYIGETQFDDIAKYMRSRGFGLFAINTNHRVSRKNNFSSAARFEQILWCEAIWFRDFLAPLNSNQELTRETALKALCLYANHGCIAFGLEMANHFANLGLLTAEETQSLADHTSSWKIKRLSKHELIGAAVRPVLHWLPRRFHSPIIDQLGDLADKPHPLASLAKR